MADTKNTKKSAPPTVQYVISESGPPNRTLIFESAAQTDDGVMRAAHKALEGTYPSEADRMVNGFTVFRSTPMGYHTPQLPEETVNGEEPREINPALNLVPIPENAVKAGTSQDTE